MLHTKSHNTAFSILINYGYWSLSREIQTTLKLVISLPQLQYSGQPRTYMYNSVGHNQLLSREEAVASWACMLGGPLAGRSSPRQSDPHACITSRFWSLEARQLENNSNALLCRCSSGQFNLPLLVYFSTWWLNLHNMAADSEGRALVHVI